MDTICAIYARDLIDVTGAYPIHEGAGARKLLSRYISPGILAPDTCPASYPRTQPISLFTRAF
jgi:hypothetical protein